MGRWPVEPTTEEVIDLLEAENVDLRNEVSDLKAQVFELKAQLYARCVSCDAADLDAAQAALASEEERIPHAEVLGELERQERTS